MGSDILDDAAPPQRAAIRCGVLGPVVVGDPPGEIANQRQRRLLVALVLGDATGVTFDTLAERVWDDDDRPRDARASLRTYVHRLRGRLGDDDIIETEAGRYRLERSLLNIDADRFQQLAAEEDGIDDPGERARLLESALTLWRGSAFDELAALEWVRPEAVKLEEQRRTLTERLLATRMDLGRHEEVASEAARLLANDPFREGLRRLQMLALYQSGRQAEALAAYEQHRRGLVEELGVDASPELRRLERLILQQDPSLESASIGRRVRAYQLGERIGAGALSVVHRANQPSVGRDVAVKIIRDELADHPDFIRRFDTEARLIARLEHPHIVPLYDYWREPGRAYLVMRLLRGGSLADAFAGGIWPINQVVRMVEQVGGALAMAHRRGVVHRDVKPANILLDDDGNAFLSDFGIATGWLIRGGRAGGTSTSQRYGAPEHVVASHVGAQADVYSLGLVALEAITGWTPTGKPGDVHEAIEGADLDGELSDLLVSTTARDPLARPSSIEQFVDGLHTAVGLAPRTDPRPPDDSEVACPYRGLEPFQTIDAEVFNGRDDDIAELVNRLRTYRLVGVTGPSGIGKSSLLRAGLIPAIQRGEIDGSERWVTAVMVPGHAPLEAARHALASVAGDGSDSVPGTMLVIDQFEQLWASDVVDDVRDRFVAWLLGQLRDRRDLRVVLGIRADRYDRPLRHPELGAVLGVATVGIGPMTAEKMAAAITRPAERVGVAIETDLVAALIDDLGGRIGALPLLQSCLTELFGRRGNGHMRLADYLALGRASGALVARAEALFLGSDHDAQLALRSVLMQLVTVPLDGAVEGRRVLRSDLHEIDGVDGVLLDQLADARLVTFDRDSVSREPVVQLAHECLASQWPRFADWVDQDHELLSIRRQVVAATDAWIEDGRSQGSLLRGSRLERALQLTRTHTGLLSAVERDLIAASQALWEDEQRGAADQAARERTSARRTQRSLRAVAIVAVLALVGGLIAVDQWHRAEEEQRDAALSALVARALVEADGRPELGLRMAIAAYRTDPGPAGQRALLGTLQAVGQRTALRVEGQHQGPAPAGGGLCSPRPTGPGVFVSVAGTGSFGGGNELIVNDIAAGTVERITTDLGCVTAQVPTGGFTGLIVNPDDPFDTQVALTDAEGQLLDLDPRVTRLFEAFQGDRVLAAIAEDDQIRGETRLGTVDVHSGEVVDLTDLRTPGVFASPNGNLAVMDGRDASGETRSILDLETLEATLLPVRDGNPHWNHDGSELVMLWQGAATRLSLDGQIIETVDISALPNVGEDYDISFSPSGDELAWLGANGLLRLSYPSLRQIGNQIEVRQPARAMSWLAPGRLAIAGEDGIVEVIDFDTDPLELVVPYGEMDSTLFVEAPGVGSDWEGVGDTVPVDLRTGRSIEAWRRAPTEPSILVIDADRALDGGFGSSAVMLDRSGSELGRTDDALLPADIHSVAIAVDRHSNQLRLVAAPENEIVTVDLDSMEVLRQRVDLSDALRIGGTSQHGFWYQDAAGTRFVVRDWSGRLVAPALGINARDVGGVVDIPGRQVVSVRVDGTIEVRDLDTGEVLHRLAADAQQEVPVLVGQDRLVVRTRAGDVTLWDRASGQETGQLTSAPGGEPLMGMVGGYTPTLTEDGSSLWFTRGHEFVRVDLDPESWFATACRLAPTPLSQAQRDDLIPEGVAQDECPSS